MLFTSVGLGSGHPASPSRRETFDVWPIALPGWFERDGASAVMGWNKLPRAHNTMPALFHPPPSSAKDAARATPKLADWAASTYAAVVPADKAVCVLCAYKGELCLVTRTWQARAQHYKQHSADDAPATDGEVRALLDAQLPQAGEARADPDGDDDAPLVAVVHVRAPYSILEERYLGKDGPVSEIVAASASGPVAVPDTPQLAKLRGQRLVAADSCLPALVRGLEQQALRF